mgnify:FL=1
MKLKKFTIFFALSIVGLLFVSPVHAEGGNLEVNVDSAKETIDLTWNEVGDTYTLFQIKWF